MLGNMYGIFHLNFTVLYYEHEMSAQRENTGLQTGIIYKVTITKIHRYQQEILGDH